MRRKTVAAIQRADPIPEERIEGAALVRKGTISVEVPGPAWRGLPTYEFRSWSEALISGDRVAARTTTAKAIQGASE